MKRLRLLLILPLLFSLTSCLNKYGAYTSPQEYHTLSQEGELYYNAIKNINIDWVQGSVVVTTSDEYTGVVVKESYKDKLEEKHIAKVWDNGNTLNIRFCSSNVSMPSNLSKNLTVYLPTNYSLDYLDIETVSSSVEVSKVTTNSLEVSVVSGNSKVSGVKAKNMDFECVSGNLTVECYPIASSIDIEQVSGNTVLSFASHNPGFTLEYETVSGKFQSDLSLTVSGEIYKYLNDEFMSVDFECVSGNLSIVTHECTHPIIY